MIGAPDMSADLRVVAAEVLARHLRGLGRTASYQVEVHPEWTMIYDQPGSDAEWIENPPDIEAAVRLILGPGASSLDWVDIHPTAGRVQIGRVPIIA